MRKIFLILFLTLVSIQTYASHIIGGEMYYDYLGNNQYKVYVVIYRDCASSGADFDNPLSLAIYTSGGSLYQSVSISAPPSTKLPIKFDNPCVQTPSGFCNERAIYTKTITLPARSGGYYLSYQRCCRTPNVVNIVTPGDVGLTLTTHIPTNQNNHYINSSPRFVNYPPLVLCNNQVLSFDHSATDADGDQLVYDLYAPYAGASTANPQPTTAPAPPYQQITWSNGFNSSNPFGAGATISIDPNTGHLTAAPYMQGMFVVGIRVREYRNGVLLSTVIRDFIFQVISCNVTLAANIVPQDQLPGFIDICQGTAVNFKNNSYGGQTYEWDFGDPTTTSDVSTQFAPSYTYPAPGDYVVTLIVNKGMPCSDTSVRVFKVYEKLDVGFSSEDSLCFNNNSFNFTGTYSGPANPTYSWNFGPNSTNQSNQLTADNVHFTTSGNQFITFTADYLTCTKSASKFVYVIPQPQASFDIMSNSECAGLTQQFTNTSTNATVYNWTFGDNGTSTTQNPTYTYSNTGTYTVTLIAGAGTNCLDTASKTIVINDSLEVSFTFQDSLCISDPNTHFTGVVNGPPNYTMQWSFGTNAMPNTSAQNEVDVTYNQAGIFPVSLTVSLATCSVTKTANVSVFKAPTIAFTFDDRLYCLPATVKFINQSQSQTPLTYHWDLGNGQTSTQKDATGTYTVSGIYSVTLTITSSVGCVGTLTLTKDSLFKVFPSPKAGFTMSADSVTICQPEVHFYDQSENAVKYVYFFDDSVFRSFDVNPTYFYTSDGVKYPYQIVENVYGCKDTMRQMLYVEPFTIFIPNAFTPDGNAINELFTLYPTLEVESWNFMIFNQWGELIYESSDPKTSWDGKYKGEVVPIGTYTYILEAISCEDLKPEKLIKGHVNVVR